MATCESQDTFSPGQFAIAGVDQPVLQEDKATSVFQFRRRRDRAINWRAMAGIDIEKIIRNIDINTLDENIDSITYCSVDEEDFAHLTPATFIKIFRLSQLMLEYLVHVQNELVKRNATFKSQVCAERERVSEMESQMKRLYETVTALKQELKMKRKNIVYI